MLSQVKWDAIALPRKFSEFVKAAWHLVEPVTKLVWAWYLEDECDHLQALVEDKFDKIIFNVPPGSAKSSIVATLFPCWVWSRDPSRRFLLASHKANLALRDSVRRRYIIKSDWYQQRFQHVQITDDQNQKSEFHNTAKGFMISMGRGGSTGFRGHYLVLDDPNNTTEMESEVQRESCLEWIDHQWSTRGDGEFKEILIQQRSHEQDVTGHYLRHGGYVHFRVPMEFDPSKRCNTQVGIHDPRTKAGELLNEKIYSKKKVELLKIKLGPYGSSGQLQQDPSPSEGGIIKRAWIRSYERIGGDISFVDPRNGTPYRFSIEGCVRYATVDLAITKKDLEKADPDYTVIAAWCVFPTERGPFIFLLDVMRDRLEGPDIEKHIEAWHEAWKFAVVGIETIGFQLIVAQSLLRKNIPVREMSSSLEAIYRIDKDKQARAYACTPLMADGRFYVPVYAPWLGEYIKELTVFPNYGHDDQVDVTSAAVSLGDRMVGMHMLEEQAKLSKAAPKSNLEPEVMDSQSSNVFGMHVDRDSLSGYRLRPP